MYCGVRSLVNKEERLFVAREMVVQEEGRNVEQIMGVRQVENKTETIRRLRQ